MKAMKAMKAEDLRTKTADELAKLLDDLKKQQFNLRFQKSQGQLENTAQIRIVRRDIARVRTFMNDNKGGNVAAGAKKAKAKTAKEDAPKTAKKTGGKKAAAKE